MSTFVIYNPILLGSVGARTFMGNPMGGWERDAFICEKLATIVCTNSMEKFIELVFN